MRLSIARFCLSAVAGLLKLSNQGSRDRRRTEHRCQRLIDLPLLIDQLAQRGIVGNRLLKMSAMIVAELAIEICIEQFHRIKIRRMRELVAHADPPFTSKLVSPRA